MKRASLSCLALVLLLPVLAIAQNPVTIEVTAYAGVPPEFRFIHYPRSGSTQDVGRPSFQAQFMIGFSFRN
jgi:hypothetical protein